MNYVIAAWVSCGVLLSLYTARILRRERSLRRLLSGSTAGNGSGNANGGTGGAGGGKWL
ncbi:MAG TPA: hypothetical protein VL984_16835 [Acidimicrobiales bacterium]|nr:hypothetical protein [Acidimicrobiales bacterium]